MITKDILAVMDLKLLIEEKNRGNSPILLPKKL
jgi:hypothetical protein